MKHAELPVPRKLPNHLDRYCKHCDIWSFLHVRIWRYFELGSVSSILTVVSMLFRKQFYEHFKNDHSLVAKVEGTAKYLWVAS